MIDLFSPVERNAAFHPHKAAIHFEGETLTYERLAARVRAVAADLASQGVGRGDRVVVLAENHPDTLVLLYACARLGAIMAPLNWRLALDELAYAVTHADPKVLAYGPGYGQTARTLAKGRTLLAMGPSLTDRADGHVATAGALHDDGLLVYTSGTTGRPKGALISQRALVWNAMQSHHMHQMTAADHVLTVLPMFHVGGLNIQTTPALMAGGTVTLHARFDPAATVKALEETRASLTVLVPTTLEAVAAQEAFDTADLSALRAVATGSTMVPETLIERFQARGITVLCVYGATETCPIAAYDRLGLPRTKGATGYAGIMGEVAVFDDARQPVAPGVHGEIGVKGAIFSGYKDDPAATQAAMHDGFVLTGDIGSLTEDGVLSVHDRKKNMIVSGGENIYPAEVERVLQAHPAVAECAVVGRPDPRWQEVPVAFVIATTPITEDVLVAHMKGLLAAFKVPRDVRLVEDLPRTALGKVRHDALKARAAAQ